ncbi:kinase-like domain-containing protein [Mycena vulgaris]|nr:kinase-like domain-containing protein [Mycena vulgaris]
MYITGGIFEDQSAEERRILQAKFAKEALVWHYLKHENIVPFLGVDSTTFPSPARAMVSPWMPLGSVLQYMKDHSPTSIYASRLLLDVILGLKYLHAVNIVHGDLCGRNILMDETGCARLTDFGLAAFVESDGSIKSSTRSGSARWMAPEVLSPPPGIHSKRTPLSDVWAFGCVCCEIWSEGQLPFKDMDTDLKIALAFASASISPELARVQPWPYQSRPRDKEDNPMPEGLWELVQHCFTYAPSERPSVNVLADRLSEMKDQGDVGGEIFESISTINK